MKNRVLYWVCVTLVFLFGATSCELINPDEPVPTTFHLNPFVFNVESGQGSANNKISEVWAYANDNYIGTFTPPVDIRYLEEGPTKLTFRPGIRNNGLENDAIIYPLFNGYTTNIVATPGSEHVVNPVTAYKNEVQFSLISDFELSNDFTDNQDTIAASSLQRTSVDVFEGNYSGQMTMTSSAYWIEVSHAVAMNDLPIGDDPIYLEFRYKNEVEFSIGLLGQDLEGHEYSKFFYVVKPSDEWNMLYIELTDLVKDSALPGYKILFRSLYPPTATKPELNIFLDNIKVVHL